MKRRIIKITNRGIGIIMGIILTAQLGKIDFNGHPETWYDLNMTKIVVRAHENGLYGSYWVDEQGLKRFGEYIIVAADWNIHPYGSLVETSRGVGIVLDTHTSKDRSIVDLATIWKNWSKRQ